MSEGQRQMHADAIERVRSVLAAGQTAAAMVDAYGFFPSKSFREDLIYLAQCTIDRELKESLQPAEEVWQGG
jgi:hypothetical protein